VGAAADWKGCFAASGASTLADADCVTPLVSRKSRAMSTTRWPRHSMIRRPESVTSATCTASRFSRRAAARKAATSLGYEDDGHAFLRFGKGDLGTVEAVVLQRHAVEVDVERRTSRRWRRRRRQRRSHCNA
jgi:hypothetical protein